MKFYLIAAIIFATFLTNKIYGQNQCTNFVGKWQCRGEIFTITQEGSILKMAYRGPNYSSNEASPCDNGQLENEGMKLTYSAQEDAFYWDGRKFARIGQKPTTTNQQPYSNQNTCSRFVGEWTSRTNGRFVVTQSGSIFKMAYKGANYNSNEASPCVNGQLENEGMKLTYSEQEDVFYWDGTKFSRVNSENIQVSDSQEHLPLSRQTQNEMDFIPFKGYVTTEKGDYHLTFTKAYILEGGIADSINISKKVLDILLRIQKVNKPRRVVIDTLSLTPLIYISFKRDNLSNGTIAYYVATATFSLFLSNNKTGKTVFQNDYIPNQDLLSKGFPTMESARADLIEKNLALFLSQFITDNFQ